MVCVGGVDDLGRVGEVVGVCRENDRGRVCFVRHAFFTIKKCTPTELFR